MKHNLKITLILLGMFVIAQLIGLAVINEYSPHTTQEIVNGTIENVTISSELPYGMQPPEVKPQISFVSIIFAIILATILLLFLSRIRAALFLKIWFFVVVVLALGITFNAFFDNWFGGPVPVLALAIALPVAFYKTFQRNLIVHNFSELLIYPGIAAVFVPILNVWFALVLLVLIAAYDIYAVCHAKFMQKMAKFQINELKVFAGFFIPYASRKDREKIEKLRQIAKKEKPSKIEKMTKKMKIKISLAILGGGDVAFPLIFAGVVLRATGLLPSLLIVLFSTISLLLLFVFARKGKFYPAMPFLSTGCIIGWLLGLLI